MAFILEYCCAVQYVRCVLRSKLASDCRRTQWTEATYFLEMLLTFCDSSGVTSLKAIGVNIIVTIEIENTYLFIYCKAAKVVRY
jgi:hypothetical protein